MTDLEPKEVDISFPRGDTFPVKFKLVDAQKQVIVPSATTEIYFTLKNNYEQDSAILQKKYSTGDITVDGENAYFYMNHTDTTGLKIGGKYKYDISVKDTDYVGTLYIGTISLTNEATHLVNE